MSDVQSSVASTLSKTSVDLNTVSTKTSKSAAMSLERPKSRFGVTLTMLVTIVALLFIAKSFWSSDSTATRLLGGILALFVAFFAFIWMRLHSFALSRRRRAWFDESNILETYQPRSRTMGHLFHPDPPTPSPFPGVQIAEPTDPELHTNEEKAAFNANRDAHYANMFEQAMRLNREMDAADDPAKKDDPAKDKSIASDVTQHSDQSQRSSKGESHENTKKSPMKTSSQRTGRSVKLVKKKK